MDNGRCADCHRAGRLLAGAIVSLEAIKREDDWAGGCWFWRPLRDPARRARRAGPRFTCFTVRTTRDASETTPRRRCITSPRSTETSPSTSRTGVGHSVHPALIERGARPGCRGAYRFATGREPSEGYSRRHAAVVRHCAAVPARRRGRHATARSCRARDPWSAWHCVRSHRAQARSGYALRATTGGLLQHLSVLFVPAGVGVMLHAGASARSGCDRRRSRARRSSHFGRHCPDHPRAGREGTAAGP